MNVGNALQQDMTVIQMIQKQSGLQHSQSPALEQDQQNQEQQRLGIETLDSSSNKHSRHIIDIEA